MILFLKKILAELNKDLNEEYEIKNISIISKPFNIDEFNEWFKTEFDGYDGRKGAAGIFLRTDKLSSMWIKEYLIHINQDHSFENVEKYYQVVRKDWINRY